MPIVDFDHYTVRSKDTAASWAFYERALGLNVRERKGFAVPAFIVSIGDREVVHIAAVRARLAANGVTVKERALPDKHQLQMTDPDGIQINLNFPLADVSRKA